MERYLQEDETVDHIDRDTLNNDPPNLQVLEARISLSNIISSKRALCWKLHKWTRLNRKTLVQWESRTSRMNKIIRASVETLHWEPKFDLSNMAKRKSRPQTE